MTRKRKNLIWDYFKHETKKNVLVKFLIIFSIVLIYLIFSMFRYGASNGLLTTILTWSMFVLCTPIADAGFLMDFPIRLLTNVRMIYSETIVWITAISLNVSGLFFYPSVYNNTALLKILRIIISNPFPYWSIIILSLIGTFLSIYFGDELIDVSLHKQRKKHSKHKKKHYTIIILFTITLVIIVYYHLIHSLGITI